MSGTLHANERPGITDVSQRTWHVYVFAGKRQVKDRKGWAIWCEDRSENRWFTFLLFPKEGHKPPHHSCQLPLFEPSQSGNVLSMREWHVPMIQAIQVGRTCSFCIMDYAPGTSDEIQDKRRDVTEGSWGDGVLETIQIIRQDCKCHRHKTSVSTTCDDFDSNFKKKQAIREKKTCSRVQSQMAHVCS